MPCVKLFQRPSVEQWMSLPTSSLECITSGGSHGVGVSSGRRNVGDVSLGGLCESHLEEGTHKCADSGRTVYFDLGRCVHGNRGGRCKKDGSEHGNHTHSVVGVHVRYKELADTLGFEPHGCVGGLKGELSSRALCAVDHPE